MVRVIIERWIKQGCESEFWEMTSQLRINAIPRQGYFSGETWIDENDPIHCIVISTWVSFEAWDAWEKSATRQAIASGVEPLLAQPVRTTVLRPPQGIEVHWERGVPVA